MCQAADVAVCLEPLHKEHPSVPYHAAWEEPVDVDAITLPTVVLVVNAIQLRVPSLNLPFKVFVKAFLINLMNQQLQHPQAPTALKDRKHVAEEEATKLIN